jgi:hypothetical protein
MRPITTSLALFAVLVVIFAACQSFTTDGGGARPARPEGPRFDHAGHIERGLDCSDCHGGEDEEWRAMPPLETCMECHEEIDGEKPEPERAAAFYNAEGQGLWAHAGKQNEEIIFSHKAHITEDDTGCLDCHQGVAESSEIMTASLLTMDSCVSCHEEKPEAAEYRSCADCHREIREDRAPPSHRLGWLREHGRQARMGAFDDMPADCSLCHKRSDCDMCHRAEPPRSHTQHFRLFGHAALASMDRHSCSTCHTEDSCAACHQDSVPRNHRGAFGSPFNRHCVDCHIPLRRSGEQGCGVCHVATPSHDMAPPRPPNPPHMTTNPADCRECHVPMPHPDNGQTCLLCHR